VVPPIPVFKVAQHRGVLLCFPAHTIQTTPALGEIIFSCTYVGEPAENSITMCSGEISLASTWHKKNDVSVAAFSFTTDAEDLLALVREESETPFQAENPIVTASNGAWAKPENIQDWPFDVYEVSNS